MNVVVVVVIVIVASGMTFRVTYAALEVASVRGRPGFSSTSSAKQVPLSSFTVRVHASINTLLQMSSLIVNNRRLL